MTLQRCERCKYVHYCSAQCQVSETTFTESCIVHVLVESFKSFEKSDWPQHKWECDNVSRFKQIPGCEQQPVIAEGRLLLRIIGLENNPQVQQEIRAQNKRPFSDLMSRLYLIIIIKIRNYLYFKHIFVFRCFHR